MSILLYVASFYTVLWCNILVLVRGWVSTAVSLTSHSESQNFGVHTAWRKAKERDTWHQVVSTATLCSEFATKKKSLTNQAMLINLFDKVSAEWRQLQNYNLCALSGRNSDKYECWSVFVRRKSCSLYMDLCVLVRLLFLISRVWVYNILRRFGL